MKATTCFLHWNPHSQNSEVRGTTCIPWRRGRAGNLRTHRYPGLVAEPAIPLFPRRFPLSRIAPAHSGPHVKRNLWELYYMTTYVSTFDHLGTRERCPGQISLWSDAVTAVFG